MSEPGHAPRDYQIEELTRGVVLPLPALKSRHLKIIAEFLVRAWEGLLETQEQVMRTKEEAEINSLMESRLLSSLDERREWSMLVHTVARGKESLSFDGSSLEKRPDLSIILTERRGFPLVGECKLIDKTARKEVALYGNEGLARFLNGDYAWYAWEAFMLAYVRDGSSIGDCLTPHLAERQKRVPDPFLTMQLPQTVKFPSQDLAQSRHERRFRDNPGPNRHLALVAFLAKQRAFDSARIKRIAPILRAQHPGQGLRPFSRRRFDSRQQPIHRHPEREQNPQVHSFRSGNRLDQRPLHLHSVRVEKHHSPTGLPIRPCALFFQVIVGILPRDLNRRSFLRKLTPQRFRPSCMCRILLYNFLQETKRARACPQHTSCKHYPSCWLSHSKRYCTASISSSVESTLPERMPYRSANECGAVAELNCCTCAFSTANCTSNAFTLAGKVLSVILDRSDSSLGWLLLCAPSPLTRASVTLNGGDFLLRQLIGRYWKPSRHADRTAGVKPLAGCLAEVPGSAGRPRRRRALLSR
jgi:hypothetical protein